jgi:AraC family transcriptional regulator of adaptative response/methylated-DNA-[protein]-cysteine methyltransferase
MTLLAPTRDEMVAAFLKSDGSFDGLFYTAVRTTGIFCIPSCRARKPLPQNVEFFETAREALFSGYRPCMRCRPMESNNAAPEWLRPLLEAIEQDPRQRWRDAELKNLGLEPARVRRHFLSKYGMTFQAYMRARRLASAFTHIRAGAEIDDVVFDSGYESHSGFRDAFERVFGCPPGQAESAGCVTIAWIETPIGPMVAGATETGVCLLEFSDRSMLETQLARVRKWCGASSPEASMMLRGPMAGHAAKQAARRSPALVPGENKYTRELRAQVDAYFAGERRDFTVPLETSGTPFQEKVWAALRTIPYGETWSYADLAKRVGNPAAVRAVAKANGDNRISILIPCHRVIGSDGELTGYGGGLWRKRALLEREGTAGLARGM